MDLCELDKAAEFVKTRLGAARPACAVILGSGWSGIAEALDTVLALDYAEIPTLGGTSVKGHPGRLILAQARRCQVLIFAGRRHWYEGQGWQPIAAPVYVALKMGVDSLLLTNAAGGIREDLAPGTLMVIDDHINAMGANPLIGPHLACWGARFPDQTRVYDRELSRLLDETAADSGIPAAHGVYLATSGPTYETPAEIEAFRRLGADAVGMSTVPEAMLAHAAGLRVAALSCITNRAAGASAAPLSHDEVIAISNRLRKPMQSLLTAVFDKLPGSGEE